MPAPAPALEPVEPPEEAPEEEGPPKRTKFWWVQPRPRKLCNAACTHDELVALLRLFAKFDSSTNVADREKLADYVARTPAVRLRRDEVFYALKRPGVLARL